MRFKTKLNYIFAILETCFLFIGNFENEYLPGNLAKKGFEKESRTDETKVLDFSFKRV